MKLKLIIQNENGEEIEKKVIEVREHTAVIVKLLKHIPQNTMNTISGSIEDGLNAGCLIVPNWAELTFVELK
jgi:hypothetical protein